MRCSSYRKAVIIVAGGAGRRMGSDLPKQYLLLGKRPVLIRTLEMVHASVPQARIVLVIAGDMFEYWRALCKEYACEVPHVLAKAGKERFFSVKAGLDSLDFSDEDLVAVHDGVRCFADKRMFDDCFLQAERYGAAVCACRSVESARYDGKAIDRNKLFSVQTPQCFKYGILRAAYNQEYDSCFTDDASCVEALGTRITMVEGERKNIKLTTPLDFLMAKGLLDAGEN